MIARQRLNICACVHVIVGPPTYLQRIKNRAFSSCGVGGEMVQLLVLVILAVCVVFGKVEHSVYVRGEASGEGTLARPH